MKFIDKIPIPSFLKVLGKKEFWAFFGTGLIVSVAYMDPGNWGTSISGGAEFNYDLLWIVWLSSIMAMLFQYISGKIGIAGHSVAGLVHGRWKSKTMVFLYWLLAEISILATDLAEFLGIVVALNLLFGIPMLEGTFLAIADVLLLLLLTRKNFRALEYAFILFVSVIGIGYLYELFITSPDLGLIATHSITPILNSQTILIAVGIIGATVMPHALFVHSWLLKNKMKENEKSISKKEALTFHTVDNVLSLFVAGLINASILIMAAAAFYNSGFVVASIDEAYRTLTPLFGSLASTVFALALLSAGISSSITGTLAGQSIMESLTDFKLSPTARRLITRGINVIPLLIAILLGIEPLAILVYSQVALSMLIPLPLIPLIYYSSKKEIMGELTNKKITTAVSSIFAIVILAFNAYLLYSVFVLGQAI
ncbi:divalent metal cation transporter [Candidatus Micrarchaeota archaeon CG10_big_fil_rev_8_21_14_0_10_45_29]|nr:MAG: divalent metal cation transporter [Candidatus Micrarchaeota archaeon CG10_big_fil_rev_8_21_14_0_10_45_29]